MSGIDNKELVPLGIMAHRRQVSCLNLTRNVPPRPSSPAHNWGSVVTRGRKNVRMPPTTIKKANDLFLLPIDSIHESPLASKRGHDECGHHGTSGLRALQTGIPDRG